MEVGGRSHKLFEELMRNPNAISKNLEKKFDLTRRQ